MLGYKNEGEPEETNNPIGHPVLEGLPYARDSVTHAIETRDTYLRRLSGSPKYSLSSLDFHIQTTFLFGHQTSVHKPTYASFGLFHVN